MRRLPRTSVLLGLIAGLALALAPQPGRAQTKATSEKVRFTTADAVDIAGTYYPSSKRNMPCVMLLHALGEDSSKKGWKTLAEALQAKGYAVLLFDFRGHGDSTSINVQEFWANPTNRSLVRGAPKDTIEFKDFDKGYYTVLVNDIAAAKAFLDRKNDAGECNSSALIVIGAETGATLGALWLNSECYRYRLNVPQPGGIPQPVTLDKEPEGKHVGAAIWLSITPTLGVRTVSLYSLLAIPAKNYEVPQVFLYSEGDPKGKEAAKQCVKLLKGTTKSDKMKFTGDLAIPGDKLRGRELLQPALGTDKAIVDYLETIREARPREWEEREFQKSQYIWMLAPNQQQPAKRAGEKTMIFSTYSAFLR